MHQFLFPPDVYRGLYGGGLQSASLLETCSSISILQEPRVGTGSARRPDDLHGIADRSGALRIERQKKIDQRLATMLSLCSMFQLFGGTGVEGKVEGRERELERGMQLWGELAEESVGCQDMSAIWWLSHCALLLWSSDSRDQHGRASPGCAKEAGHVHLQVPWESYMPPSPCPGGIRDARTRGSQIYRRHDSLVLSAPSPIIVLQRLLAPQFAVLMRHSAVFVPAQPSATTCTDPNGSQVVQDRTDSIFGVNIGLACFERERMDAGIGWRVCRLVCLARGACVFAAESPLYHHTLHIFFHKFSEFLSVLPSPVSVGEHDRRTNDMIVYICEG
jgi:hypothetical protein